MRGDVFREATRRRRMRAPEQESVFATGGSALGAIIGAYFGGPQGAMKGYQIGQMGGGLLDREMSEDDVRRYEAIRSARRYDEGY